MELKFDNGSIVAFEGDEDTVGTQLRLLPTSQNILILPSLETYLPNDGDEYGFSAEEFVGRVHSALRKRNDVAHEFLHSNPSTGKRLVFLNGGVANAQSKCIRAIMDHETAGDEVGAEVILNRVVQKGAYALAQSNKRKQRASKRFHPSEYDDFGLDSDPITRAMRAADALDRQTANLQPSTELDLTFRRHSRSSSLPLYGYSDNVGDAAPFLVFGAPAHGEQLPDQPLEEASLKTPRFSVVHYGEQKGMPSIFGFDDLITARPSPSCAGETYTPLAVQDSADNDAISPMSEAFSIRTMDTVVYGRASVLDVRRSMIKAPSLTRVKSLDRLQPLSPKFRDLCLPECSTTGEADSRPKSWMEGADEKTKRLSSYQLSAERPQTVLVMAKPQPTVRISAVPEGKKRRERSGPAYVDRGTDADESATKESAFEPIFPLVEELVVHIKDASPNKLLASALAAFKEGRYPYLSHSAAASEAGNEDSAPATPNSEPLSRVSQEETQVLADSPEARSSTRSSNDDEYDPFAYTNPSFKPPKTTTAVPTVTIIRPPTPAQTPPPPPTTTEAAEPKHKVHELQLTAGQTPVSIQNSIRAILGDYFPSESQGNHGSFQFPLLRELKGLWQPIFRERRSEDSSASAAGRKLKQILAIGLQRGVKKEYGARVMGQLERFGTEPSGSARCSRLDFRYLLANTMQSFTSQPLANQMSDNPFANPYHLATILLPHLETYLTLHSDIRYLLLEYPPEHLPTVVAIQKLAGVDLVKVAQIVDSSSKEELPFRHIRGASIGSSNESKTSRSSKSTSDVSVTKANFLLTSTASDKDIAGFVSAVWNIEAKNRPASSNASDKATPAPASPPKSKRKPKPAPLNLTAFPKATGPQSPLSPTANIMSVLAPPPKSPAPSQVTAVRQSPLPPIKSAPPPPPTPSKSIRGRRPDDAMSVYTFDPRDDSDYDEEERRLMPMFLQKRKPRKGNTKKALQFLGLTV